MSVAALTCSKSILHVSSAHRISDGRITKKEAAALARFGYDVTVLALRRAQGATLPAALNCIEYDEPCSRAYRFLVRLPWLIWYCAVNRYDAYHLHDPELILLGLVLRMLGRRVVYDAHEVYPMVILDRDWIPHFAKPALSSLWRRFEAFLVRHAHLTIVAHESVRDQYDQERVVVVHNYPILPDIRPLEEKAMPNRPNVVIHHGDLTRQRGLYSMVEAMGMLDKSSEASLHLAGNATGSTADYLAKLDGSSRTQFLGWLDGAALADELGNARAGLVLLHPTNNFLKIRPNKLYEYMAAGLPVIVSDFPHWREIVESTRCGILVDPLDCLAIARAIDNILQNPEDAAAMGRRGREAAVERFNWQHEQETVSYTHLTLPTN